MSENDPTFVIREATPDDAERLIAHVNRVSEEPGVNIPTGPGEFTVTPEEERKILREYAEAPNSVFLVAEAPLGEGGHQIVGVLNCKGYAGRRALRHCTTLGISVRRDWRCRGVGSALMVRAIEWARSAGVRRIELAVYARNTTAIRLYERFGFQVEGRRRNAALYEGEYIDDFIMALLL